MSSEERAALCIDYQNLYHKAREYGHDFHIVPYIEFLQGMYNLEREDVFVFMGADFYKDMHVNAKNYVNNSGILRLSNHRRSSKEYDPVDGKMVRKIKSAIRGNNTDIILVGSSDKIFADLGTLAWNWNKEFHVYPYADPAGRYRKHTATIQPIHDLIAPRIRF